MTARRDATAASAPDTGPAARECVLGVPLWLVLVFAIALTANLLATVTTARTIDLMRSISPFANAVRARDLAILGYWRAAAYTIFTIVIVAYLWPIIAYFRAGTPAPLPAIVQRRALEAPPVIALLSFTPWILAILFFPLQTLVHFGRWTPELLSQHVYSPLVNGFLAAATSYLLIDWVFRTLVVPRVFPEGRLVETPGSMAPGVRGRLLVFLVAVAFVPLFTMLGLVRAGLMRVSGSFESPETMIAQLASAGTVIFVVFVALGIVLTLVIAQTLTRALQGLGARGPRLRDRLRSRLRRRRTLRGRAARRRHLARAARAGAGVRARVTLVSRRGP